MTYTFTLDGPIMPYVRMTQRGKYVKPRAQAYMAQQEALGMLFKTQMAEHGWEMLGRQPLGVEVLLAPAKHNGDADNQLKAVADAMNGIVYEDDRWIDRATIARVGKGEGRVIVRVWRLTVNEIDTIREAML